MCRFKGPEDTEYKKVAAAFVRILTAISTTPTRAGAYAITPLLLRSFLLRHQSTIRASRQDFAGCRYRNYSGTTTKLSRNSNVSTNRCSPTEY
jgi:hypothetical protein